MSGRQRVALEPAWLLRTQPYGDTGLLLEAWTEQHGRIGLVARGVRSARSRTRALLQVLRPLLLSWTGSGDLGTLTGVEADGPPPKLPGESQLCGWYVNELLLRLTQRHDPQPAVFDLYRAAIDALAARPDAPAGALRSFEFRLLTELGYGLWLDEELDAEASYRVVVGDVPESCEPDAPGAVSGRTLIALRDDDWSDARDLRIARQLLRAQLQPLLGDRPLRSAELLRSLRGLQSTATTDEPPDP